eukprot:scaffold26577_cov70-Skeletonema_dohrnii-CCMP3373.AAC.4
MMNRDEACSGEKISIFYQGSTNGGKFDSIACQQTLYIAVATQSSAFRVIIVPMLTHSAFLFCQVNLTMGWRFSPSGSISAPERYNYPYPACRMPILLSNISASVLL